MGNPQTPPSTLNYTIPKGVLSIEAWAGNTPPGSYTDIGNCPSVEVEQTLERLPHYSSRSELRLRDANPIIQSEYTVRFTCDEIASANLNRFLMGSLSGSIISAFQNTELEWALKFVGDNPIGPSQTWEFWKGTLTPNGPLQLVGEEWMVMDFMFEGLADIDNNASSPYFTVTYSSSSSSSSSVSSSSSSSSSSTG